MLAGGQYRLDGRTYSLPKHGFARHKLFEAVQADARSAVLRLRADDETRAAYPFEFQLDVGFALAGATLTMEAAIHNLGEADMPASFGFHPAFRWPLPFGRPRPGHAITFAEPEPALVRRMDSQGLLKPEGQPTPIVGRTLQLRDDLFEGDALMLDQLESAGLRYGAEDGPALTLDFPDTPYLGVWTKPGADFIAIEPWHGINDTEGFDGDLWAKPGIFAVPSGEARRLSMSVTLTAS